MRVHLLALVALAAIRPAAAQAVADSTLQPFAFLVGQWEGPGWYLAPTGEHVAFAQTENVRPMSGGQVIVIEGRGRSAEPPGDTIFRAFGVLSPDAATGTVYLDAYTDGRHIRTEATPTPGGFAWGFEAGGRQMRYVMHLDEAGRWVETGEVLVGPDRWIQSVELTLSRRPPAP